MAFNLDEIFPGMDTLTLDAALLLDQLAQLRPESLPACSRCSRRSCSRRCSSLSSLRRFVGPGPAASGEPAGPALS